MKLRTAALVLALAWPGLALGQAHPGVGTPNFASMSADGAIAAGGLLSGATLSVGGTGPIAGFGSAIGQALWLTQYGATGFPGFTVPGRLIFSQTTPAANDYAVLHLRRVTSFTAAPGTGSSSILHLEGALGANDGTFNTGVTTTFSTAGAGSVAGAQLQATRLAGATGLIWGSISDSIDQNNASSATANVTNHAGAEIDVETNSADDAANGQTFGGIGVRKGVHMVLMRWNQANTAQTELSNGIWFSSDNPTGTGGGDAHSNYQSVLGFGVNTQIRNALDTRGAITPAGSANPVSAVTMTAGHIVDFNGPTTITGAPRNYLWWDSGSSRWKYTVAGVDKFSVDASGNVRAAGTVTGSTTP